MYGADVGQLHELARQFEHSAERLEATRMTVGNGIRISAWVGPFAAKFRLQWDSGHSVRVLGAARLLQEAAYALRRNADEQDRTSATDISAQQAGAGGRAPLSTAGYIDALHAMDGAEDGVRIQRVHGEDGVVRCIVYLDGTDSASDGLFEMDDNVELMTGRPNDTLEYVRAKIRTATADDPDVEVMLVGYSQGGILAQRLADEGAFNVSMVAAYGSPTYHPTNNYGGADVLRLEHNGDSVPSADGRDLGFLAAAGLPVVGPVLQGASEVLHATEAARDITAALSPRDPAPAGADVTFRGGDMWQVVRGGYPHVDRGDYTWLSDRFDQSGDQEHVAMRERMARFRGQVIHDEM